MQKHVDEPGIIVTKIENKEQKCRKEKKIIELSAVSKPYKYVLTLI